VLERAVDRRPQHLIKPTRNAAEAELMQFPAMEAKHYIAVVH
jgi:hypothetical protein